jgi:hypothetical protein
VKPQPGVDLDVQAAAGRGLIAIIRARAGGDGRGQSPGLLEDLGGRRSLDLRTDRADDVRRRK